ncbi:glycosyltransferase family 4 protein [Paludisphaera borealis]|uniref:GT4 family glycosyltransferase n=1 Tax=Paludisphaera borealis TaxID=1387353 RepID=A0A1U7CXF8_9BACT|nr:glycosyltransferase family 4 protein [Paludisphaera borealis]APW63569.1 GT4 family glycosyltransferase [Paludisphaera borealis]
MRVLMVTSFPIPGEYDGTAMLPIKILRALKPRGVDVVVAHLRLRPPGDFSTKQEDFEGTPVFSLPMSAWLSGQGLEKIAKDFPFDVVHAQSYGGATRAYFACSRNKWPMVYEIHSLLGDEVERDRLGRGILFRSYKALERRAVNRAAWIIALGEPVKQVVVDEKGVPADRVSVIYPGIDLGEYERPGEPAAIPGIGPEHKVVMYIGSIVHPNQGVPILVDALPKIFNARPDARCVLVGGPAEAGEEYRRQLGVHGDRLIVLTGQTPEQVVALSRRADVLVHPRLACRENFSVQSKIAVYLAAGRPIVATDFGDYRKLLGESGAGILTEVAPEPLADGILRVLNDPDLAASLAAATGPVAREHFAMDRNVDRYLEVYRRAMELGPR